MASKTLFIGLDGAEPQLLRDWADQGLLPNLKQVLDRYCCRPIVSPAGFGDGGLWSSLVTGVNPGKHGHYFPEHFNPQTYMLDHYSIDTDMRRDPFWFFCSKMERTVGIIDIYTSALRTGLRGVQVMDWMIHDRMGTPLIDTLHEKYMVDPLGGNTEVESRSTEEYLEMHQGVMDRIVAKTNACVDLLNANEWDLFCVGYCDAHDIGHQSWHWHDPSNPAHPADLVAQHGDPLLQSYQGMDTAVGHLLEAAKPEQVFLVAGLGMDKQSLCNTGLQQILAHYCGIDGNRDYTIQQRKRMPYFELPHNMHGGAVRINLKGRESSGIIERDDYDQVLAELTEKFHRLEDADTGESVVKEVVFVHETCPGPFQNNLPDLFVVWKKPISVTRIKVDEDKIVELEPFYSFEYRSGDHTSNALFASSIDYTNDQVMTEAIAPTICATLGVNLPDCDADALIRV